MDPKKTNPDKNAPIDRIAKSLVYISLAVLGYANVAGMSEHCAIKNAKHILPSILIA